MYASSQILHCTAHWKHFFATQDVVYFLFLSKLRDILHKVCSIRTPYEGMAWTCIICNTTVLQSWITVTSYHPVLGEQGCQVENHKTLQFPLHRIAAEYPPSKDEKYHIPLSLWANTSLSTIVMKNIYNSCSMLSTSESHKICKEMPKFVAVNMLKELGWDFISPKIRSCIE